MVAPQLTQDNTTPTSQHHTWKQLLKSMNMPSRRKKMRALLIYLVLLAILYFLLINNSKFWNKLKIQKNYVTTWKEYIGFHSPDKLVSEFQDGRLADVHRMMITETHHGDVLNSSNPITVVSGGHHILDRLLWLNTELQILRQAFQANNTEFIMINHKIKDEINAASTDFHFRMANMKNIRGIYLTWSEYNGEQQFISDSNLFIDTYYTWTFSENLCAKIRSREPFPKQYNKSLNYTCSDDIESLIMNRDLGFKKQMETIKSSEVAGFSLGNSFNNNRFYYSTYLHIIDSGAVSTIGTVSTNGTLILPRQCKNIKDKLENTTASKLPFYKEVIVASQYWGEGFFHKMVENFPRLTPFIPFLIKYPNIKIHMKSNNRYSQNSMRVLGIDPLRIITGKIRAKWIYLPKGTACGNVDILQGQLFSKYHQVLNQTSNVTHSKEFTLVQIIRTHGRGVTSHVSLTAGLKRLAEIHSLEYVQFSDAKLPGFMDTIGMFRRAALVVAPHGAGLSNLLYSQPGTAVVEALCEPPHTNFCYMTLANRLGLMYHGVMATGHKCEGRIDISAEALLQPAERFLKMRAKNLTISNIL